MNEKPITTLLKIKSLENRVAILSAALIAFQKVSGLTRVDPDGFLYFETRIALTPEQAKLFNALDVVMDEIAAENKSVIIQPNK